MTLLMRLLMTLILLALIVVGLGLLAPERFGLFGMLGWVVLIIATVFLGVAQIIHMRRPRP
jgi:hypothetical protein